MMKRFFAASALVVGFVASPASAANIMVNFSGTLQQLGDYSADLTLDVVDGQTRSATGTIQLQGESRALGLVTTDTPGNIDESASYPGFPVGFRSNGGDDLFGADQAYPLTQGGLLFVIGTTTPTFGENALINFYNNGGTLAALAFGTVNGVRAYNDSGTLTITDRIDGGATPAVPEPATWAMMLVGFGMIGAASRYRRRVKVSFA